MRSKRFILAALFVVAAAILSGCEFAPAFPLPTVTPVAGDSGSDAPDSPAPGALSPLPTPDASLAVQIPLVIAGPVPVESAAPSLVPIDQAPVGSPASAGGCIAAEGQSILSHEDEGYCFAHDDRFKSIGNEPGKLFMVGPALDQGAEPVMATLRVAVSEAGGNLEAAAKAALTEFSQTKDWQVNRLDGELGGVPAVVFEPVPGRMSGRTVVAVHAGKLYRLDFWPVDVEAALPDVNELYNDVIATWQFVPGASAVAISGSVILGDNPVAGAVVELRSPDGPTGPNGIVATATTDSSGKYRFAEPFSGRYEIVAAFPPSANETGKQPSSPVIVPPGGEVKGLNVYLVRQIKLLEPGAGAEVDGSPLLKWEAVKGAVTYRVIVNDPATGQGYFGADVKDASVKVDPPLAAGTSYAWVVNALTAKQGLLGVGEGTFTVR